jgi:hypothetical protein
MKATEHVEPMYQANAGACGPLAGSFASASGTVIGYS